MSQTQFPTPNQDNFDKTMVEGSAASLPISQLPQGAKINVAQTRVAPKTYVGGSMGGSGPGEGILPSGDEPVPLGSGTIAGRLGTGGMATVYKIWNEKLEVFRAIKILLPSHQDDLKSRFETEGKITAKLRHPNVVEIFAVGDWNGLPFLEMELIEGQSLEAYISRTERLPFTVCAAVAAFVARALVYAHSQEVLIYGKTYQGVIHRDLKPANIMIDKNGKVKLMDFGIARPTETSLHTVEGNIVGTLPYLSPEQIDGVDIDARVDIYALGTILYEMVTGLKTFPQKSVTNLMKNKITNQYRTFEDFDFKVPPALTKIVQKCLQVERDDRYKNAKALLDALEAALATMTILSPDTVMAQYCQNPTIIGDTRSYKNKQGFQLVSQLRKPAVWGSLAGAVLLGGVALAFFLTGPKGEVSEAAKTVLPSQSEVVSSVSQTANSTQVDTAGLRPLSGVVNSTEMVSEVPEVSQPKAVQKLVPTQEAVPVAKKSKMASQSSVDVSTSKKSSPLEVLVKKYNGTDAFSSGEAALRSGSAADAIALLESVTESSDRRTILLLDAYLQGGRMNDAKVIISGSPVNDAQFVFLSGFYSYKTKNLEKALDYFQSAFTKKSDVRQRQDVVNDALYYTALIRTDNYGTEPSEDNKRIAMQSWLAVKKAYAQNDTHARYQRATKELSAF